MRISIPTVDSRGDVQPNLAPGSGLHAVGHEVRPAFHSSRRPAMTTTRAEPGSRAAHASERQAHS